jgi:hypothetical protein
VGRMPPPEVMVGWLSCMRRIIRDFFELGAINRNRVSNLEILIIC